MFNLQFNPYSLLATVIFFMLVYASVNIIFFQGEIISKRSSRFVLINLKNDIDKILDNTRLEKEFFDTGLNISFLKHYRKYQIIRYVTFLTILIILLFKSFTSGISVFNVIILMLLFLITSTKLKFGKQWTLFGHAMRFVSDEYKKKQDVELSSIIIQLQNIAVSQKDEPTTLTHMLSRVVRFANHTKVAFIKMISYIDQGKEDLARDSFISEIDTNLGRDLAYILIELDRIEPSQVINQLKLLEDRVRKENLTNKSNMEEFYSNLIYVIPTLLCFMILLNFLMIILNLVTTNTNAF